MPVNWKPETWAMLAQSSPDVFLKELSTQRKPPANVFTKTYLECVIRGFNELKKHNNTQYESAFFLELIKLPPHNDAKKAEFYDVDRVQWLDVQRAPIEYLLWQDVLQKQCKPKSALNYHAWLLQLKKPSYDLDKLYNKFSLNNAPQWASGYVEIQRGCKQSSNLGEWLQESPIDECLTFLTAAGSLHEEEKPAWLVHSLEWVFSARANDCYSASVFHVVRTMRSASKMPTASLDTALVSLIREQPNTTMSFLTHAWFGGWSYGSEGTNPMLEWWARQTPENRGFMLHKWLNSTANWETITRESPSKYKPNVALDLFTRDSVAISSHLAKDIVRIAPFENAMVREFLPRIIPALYMADLTVDPKDFKAYLLNSWDVLYENVPTLSVDGLIDLEP